MALHNTDSILIGAATAAESLPDPTTVAQRMHFLINNGAVTTVWSSVGATPFTEGGVNVATISVTAGNYKLVQSNGTNWIVASPNEGLAFPTISTPARVIGTAFTPNANRPVLGIYTVEIGSLNTTLAGGTDGTISLLADNAAPATVRCSTRGVLTQLVGVTVGMQAVHRDVLMFLFPAGWQGNITSTTGSGAPTFAIINQVEIAL